MSGRETVRRDNVEYHAGRDARRAGKPSSACPYAAGGERAARWSLGWEEEAETVRQNRQAQREAMGAIADKENPATAAVQAIRTVDVTPTWRALVPLFRAAIESGTETGRRIAWEELARMAEAADIACAESPVASLADKLERLESLVAGFHAVKQIRAHAAEENQETKRAALALIAELRAETISGESN